MHTLSSARRTCMASASAVEWTATVRIPISRQARWMRSAISPRLAIRTFSNMLVPMPVDAPPCLSIDHHQNFAILHRAPVADQNLANGAAGDGWNRVHHLHGFDDEKRLSLGHPIAN